MTDDSADSGEPGKGTIEKARLRDNERRLELATLPDGRDKLTPEEAETLVAEFRRSRDGHRGRYAADLRDLPAPGNKIAAAIVKKSKDVTDRAQMKRLAEDLVDLQAFVDLHGAPAPLPPGPGQKASPVLELIRERQAAAMHFIRQDPSVVGDKVAQGGKWTAIGRAREALDRTRDYRDDQAAGLLAVVTFVIAGTAGAITARLFVVDQFTLLALVVLFVAWFATGWIGAQVFRVEGSLLAAIETRWRHVPDSIALVLFFAVVIPVEFAIGFLAVVVTASLGLP